MPIMSGTRPSKAIGFEQSNGLTKGHGRDWAGPAAITNKTMPTRDHEECEVLLANDGPLKLC
jgi:hypothetical protein